MLQPSGMPLSVSTSSINCRAVRACGCWKFITGAYRNPSKRSTGGHLHFQWADQANADKFAQLQKGGIAGNELANVEAINTEYARYIDRLSESRAMLGQETELAKLNAQIKLGMFAELSPAQQDTMRQLAGMYDQEQALFDLRSKMKDLQSEYNNAMQFGMPFDEQGALTELYQNNLVALQNYYDAQMALSADNEERLQQLRLQYAQDTGRMLESYNLQSQSLTLATTGEFFGQMGDLVKAFGGEQSNAYRSMIMVQKAANLASVLMSGYKAIAEAYASAPFPANIPAVAAATVKTGVLSAAVQAITPAFADGGHVVGAGTGRSDSIPALLSNGEFVINAQATAKNRSLLEAINSNRYADGGIVGSGQWDKGRKSGTQVNVGDVQVNIENGGGDSEIDAAQAKQLGHAIKNAVREEIAKQARPGGILAQRG